MFVKAVALKNNSYWSGCRPGVWGRYSLSVSVSNSESSAWTSWELTEVKETWLNVGCAHIFSADPNPKWLFYGSVAKSDGFTLLLFIRGGQECNSRSWEQGPRACFFKQAAPPRWSRISSRQPHKYFQENPLASLKWPSPHTIHLSVWRGCCRAQPGTKMQTEQKKSIRFLGTANTSFM